MLDVKLLPCKEIRAWRKGKDELCDANAMVKCDIRIENQSSDAKFRYYILAMICEHTCRAILSLAFPSNL